MSWLHGACLAAVLGVATAAFAIPKPMPDAELEKMSSVVVEGEVISATYLGEEDSSRLAVSRFRGELKVRKVIKGDVKKDALLVLLWFKEAQIQNRSTVDGRVQQPFYYPCEVVRAYLHASKDRGTYITAFWNGRRTLKAPHLFKVPTPQQKTLRCVGGAVKAAR